MPTKATYLVAFAVILPFGGALFSQPLASSRANDDRVAPERVVMMTATLRTMFSVAWVVVVPVAGWIAGARSVFDVFTFAAIGHLGCAAVSAFLRLRPDTRVPPAPRPREAGPRRSVWKLIGRRKLVGLAGVLSIRTAIMLRLTLLPLAMINDYHGGYGDVGLTAALAAGLEVPLMLVWGYLAGRVSREKVMILNAAIYAGYLASLVFARSPRDVLWLQIPNAVATAALLGLTISYVQDSIKGQVGLSTSIVDVMTVLATTLAAGGFRLFSGEASYLTGFVAAAGSSLLGAALLWGSEREPGAPGWNAPPGLRE